MKNGLRPHFATLSHPLTGARFRVRARTESELDLLRAHIARMREELRLNLTSADEVDRKLRRLRHGPVTLERAARSYVGREDLAPNTRRRVTSILKVALAPIAGEELDALDGPRLAPLFARLARQHSRESMDQIWRTLRAVVRHAAERGWTARIPWGAWRPRRAGQPGRPLRECARNASELEALVSAARALDAAGPFRALEAKILAMSTLGLRQSELAGLRWYDLRPSRGTVVIARKWQGAALKTGEGAELAAPKALFAALAVLYARAGGPDEVPDQSPIFPAPGGGHYTGGECLSTRSLRECVQAAHLDMPLAWSPHSLRDTFVTLEAAIHGGDFRTLAARTRHRSVASLVRYLRSFDRRGGGAPLLGP